MKFPLRVSLPATVRTYATRRAERPPSKIRDPLVSPNATHHQLTPELTFIHRPPPTAPTPFSLTTAPSSPLLLSPSAASTSQTTDGSAASYLPPLMKRSHEWPRTMLTEDQVKELKRLRAANPATNTRRKLAGQFGCSPNLIPILAPLSKTEMRKALDRREQGHEAIRRQWGERKAMVVAIRQKRRSLW